MDSNLTKKIINKLPPSIKVIKAMVYDLCDVDLPDYEINSESVEYDAYRFRFKGKKHLYIACPELPLQMLGSL